MSDQQQSHQTGGEAVKSAGSEPASIQETNLIRTCIEKHFDSESYAKFQQVLEYMDESVYVPLYQAYNTQLLAGLEALTLSKLPDGYSMQVHISLKVKFYAFRFISSVGKFLLEKIKQANEKAEYFFFTLTKILLYHAFISKSDTANLALVELEQLCSQRHLTLSALYMSNRTKFLRLIIKAVLYKIITNNDYGETNSGDVSDNGNGNNSSWSSKRNPIIAYMTRAFEVFNVASITRDDVAQSLVILTNLTHKEKYDGAIKLFLEYLAKHQNIDMCTLIRSHIQTIVVSLLFRRKLSLFDMHASINKLCSFCGQSPREILATKFTFIKGRLLLHYSIDPKLVTDGIYFLSKFEKEEMYQPFEDEFEDEKHFIDYLDPSMIGILLGVDAHFTSSKDELGSDESIKHVESLIRLITLLTNKQIEAKHVKLLSTLSLLLRLRPQRDNQRLNKVIIDLWSVFVSKLSQDLRASLLISICVALYDLIEDCPSEVADLYNNLICKASGSNVKDKYKSLFFIPNIPEFSKIYKHLTPHVRRDDSVKSLQELQKSLDCVLPLMTLENHKCLLLALTKLRQLLKSNHQLLTSNMLVNLDESLDPIISKTIESLLALSSTQDPGCSALIAECLGTLGAVNPNRLDHLIYGEISEGDSLSVVNLSDPTFIVELLEKLKHSLLSDQRSESETANYSIQVVVKTYNIFNNKSIKEKLSEEALRSCEICQNTSYIGTKKSQPDISVPVYEKFKSENLFSYNEWLDKFFLNLVSIIKGEEIRTVLNACSYVFKYNQKLAEFLLSHAIIQVILNKPEHVTVIHNEITSILNEDVGVSTQDLDTVYNQDVRGNIQTLHFQCANMIFCALDATHRLLCNYRNSHSASNERHQLRARNIELLKAFIKSIPKDKLALLASKCRAHSRALCYFEQYFLDNKNQLDKFATTLQRIYVALDDPYEASGVEMIRTTPTTITDDIVNYEACGRFDKAAICYGTSLEHFGDGIDQESFIEDALRCFSNQGDHQRLYEKSKQLLNDHPNFKRNILPAAIEASWKLGRWDELRNIINIESVDNLLESSCVSQGYLLNGLIYSSSEISDKLKIVRNRLMKPLSIAMLDRSAYFRGYQSLLVLHSIEDFALSLEVLERKEFATQQIDENTVEKLGPQLQKMLNSLFEVWGKRNRLVQPSIGSLEPLMGWQRSISLVLQKKYPFLKEKIDVDVGCMWLDSADSAREARNFDRSFFCLTQAQQWFGEKFHKLNLDLQVRYYTEQAKLDWAQGEKTKAIKCLKLSLERLKDHEISQHLNVRRARSRQADSFPQLNNMIRCSQCESFGKSERESFTRLKMLLTHYCEEAAAGIPETLFFMYEECVHLGVSQEETYFRLARYYDRLLVYYMENPKLCGESADERSLNDATQRFSQNLVSGDKEEVYTKLMEHSIIAFGYSLKYGAKYLNESMPRMLNIWYDLGSKKVKGPQPGGTRVISSRIESTVRFIDELKNKSLPPYFFMTAISIILTRVCHPHSGVSKKTCEILELLLMSYPYQIAWHMIALFNDHQNDDRKRAVKQIYLNIKKKSPKIDNIVVDTLEFSKILVDLCHAHGPTDKQRPESKKKKLNGVQFIKDISLKATSFDFSKVKVIAPCQATMRAILPMDNDRNNLEKHVVFPEHNIVYIRSFGCQVRIYNSLQKPKRVVLKCNDGGEYPLLCKAGDDLRKDSRCVEFFNLLNRILRRDSQSNARFFDISTFLVLPLDSEAGIIEMLPDCDTLRNVIEHLYRERKSDFVMHDDQLRKARESNPSILHELYKTVVKIKMSPPVLPIYFLRRFTEPTSWYMARLAYTRSCAVISMGGYIIGLGDRHLDNILINTKTGKIVQVDFNLLFHQAESLPVPETVPFRLTHNIVAAFGAMGTEGNFRKVSEITMRVMRKEKDAILTTLKPFLHDPCSEWIKVRDPKDRAAKLDQEDKHAGNRSAKVRLEVIERKLKGFPRSKKFKPLTLFDSYSVEAQVDNLIEEAMDTYNLSLMYFGWCPHI